MKDLRIIDRDGCVMTQGAMNAMMAQMDAKDETIATLKRQVEVLLTFAKDCSDGFDCDADAHKHGTMCRCCAAAKILGELEQAKKVGGQEIAP